MADATRALPGNWHDEPSSPSPAQILSCNLDYRTGGSLLESTPGLILESAEAQLEKTGIGNNLDWMAHVALHFFSDTRWKRTLHVVR